MPYRLNWICERVLSAPYRRRLGSVIVSQTEFFGGALRQSVGNDTKRVTRLRLRSGQTAYMNSFTSYYIFDEIFLQGVYRFEAKPRLVLDIGANIGLFSLWASQQWPGVEISAYEPEPDNYRVLRMNVECNGLSNVRTFEAAITPDGAPITLFRHKTNSGAHSTVRRSRNAVHVGGCSLDAALDTFSTGHCDLLKADCEGAEGEILRNMTAAQARRVRDILYEPEPKLYSVTELNDALGRLGYETKDVQSESDTSLNHDLQGMVWAHRTAVP